MVIIQSGHAYKKKDENARDWTESAEDGEDDERPSEFTLNSLRKLWTEEEEPGTSPSIKNRHEGILLEGVGAKTQISTPLQAGDIETADGEAAKKFGNLVQGATL